MTVADRDARRREYRDVPAAELLNRGEHFGMHDAIDTPQRAVEIGHHQFDRRAHHDHPTNRADRPSSALVAKGARSGLLVG